MSTTQRARPRIIRRVTDTGRDGRPKEARDRKAHVIMERIKARTDKPCGSGVTCRQDAQAMIMAGDEYAKVTDRNSYHNIGWRKIPDVANYHFECVPPEARPLVRFFVSRNP